MTSFLCALGGVCLQRKGMTRPPLQGHASTLSCLTLSSVVSLHGGKYPQAISFQKKENLTICK